MARLWSGVELRHAIRKRSSSCCQRAWRRQARRARRGIAQRRAFPQARIHIAGCRHPDSPPGAAPGRPADLGAALAANHKIAIFKMYSNAIANPQNKTCRRPGCSTGSRRNQVTTQNSRLWNSKRVQRLTTRALSEHWCGDLGCLLQRHWRATKII